MEGEEEDDAGRACAWAWLELLELAGERPRFVLAPAIGAAASRGGGASDGDESVKGTPSVLGEMDSILMVQR